MNTTSSIIIGVAIIAYIGYDAFANDGGTLVFLARKFARLLDWIAFWR